MAVHRLRGQQDRDAKWTRKRSCSCFGYGNHIGIDHEHKLIRRMQVTDAAVHDDRVLEDLLDPDAQAARVWADSAYRSRESEQWLKEQDLHSRVHYRARRNRPLTAAQLACNRVRSQPGARVEHVFGHPMQALAAGVVRTIGRHRAAAQLLMGNLMYDMRRYRFLVARQA